MKDEYYKETVRKIIISVVVFLILIGGICAYMFWPENNEEIEYNNDLSEVIEETEEV